jgi:hypothetical protein
MGEEEKRLQEIEATLKLCLQHMLELYQEKEKILADHNISMQKVQMEI